jgi:hypothetical protein
LTASTSKFQELVHPAGYFNPDKYYVFDNEDQQKGGSKQLRCLHSQNDLANAQAVVDIYKHLGWHELADLSVPTFRSYLYVPL